MNGFLDIKLKIGKETKRKDEENQLILIATVTTSKKQTVRLFKWL